MKVIGICGPSCSGKSSISKELAKNIDCNIINCDHYYKLGSEKVYVEYEGKTIRSFERPENYDGKLVAKIITELKTKKITTTKRLIEETSKEIIEEKIKEKPVLIVEGFHILNYPELAREIDKSFFIELPFQEIKKRRLKRSNRAGKDIDFIKIGEIEWEKFGEGQKEKADFILDGQKSTEKLADEVISKL